MNLIFIKDPKNTLEFWPVCSKYSAANSYFESESKQEQGGCTASGDT